MIETIDDSNSISNRGKKLSTWLYPADARKELKGLLELFIPCFLSNLFKFLNPMISVIMCGNLSRFELDAAALANTIIFVFGLTIDLGFSTAFDTLFSQIYGSGQIKKMGVLLQRAIIVMSLLYLILACFHLNIEPILIGLRQDPLVAELTTLYLTIYIPGLFFEFQFLTMSRYLQNQNIVCPMVISTFLANIFNTFGQYIAIRVYGFGLEASAFFQGTSNVIMFLVQLCYVLISGVYRDSWDGFSIRCALDNWSIIFVIGIPGIFMIGLGFWSFEISTFIAGSLGTVQLGAQAVAMQTGSVGFMIVNALGIAVTIRVGQCLGSREIDRLKQVIRLALTVGAIVSIITFAVIFTLRKRISALFSNDELVQDEASVLLIILATFQFVDVINVLTHGILKASGRQLQAAFILVICFYIIGIPIGLTLVYVAKMNIKGMWIGIACALISEAVIFSFLTYFSDWERECDKALANTKHLKNHQFNEYEVNNKESIDETDAYEFKKTIIRRVVTISMIVVIFLGSLLARIYVPKSSYLPCIPMTNKTVIMYKNYPNMLCNSTLLGTS